MAARRRVNPTPVPPVPPHSGPNACDPAAMTPQDRLAEIARILARGVARFALAHRRRPGRAPANAVSAPQKIESFRKI